MSWEVLLRGRVPKLSTLSQIRNTGSEIIIWTGRMGCYGRAPIATAQLVEETSSDCTAANHRWHEKRAHAFCRSSVHRFHAHQEWA